MNLSHITFSTSKKLPIKIQNPLQEYETDINISDCCDQIIGFQYNHKKETFPNDELIKTELWLQRQWHESLDYYASSPTKKKHYRKITRSGNNKLCVVDISLSNVSLKKELSPLQALMKRKTYRKFLDRSLSFEVFSSLMQALKNEIYNGIWKYYLIIFDVQKITPGIYLYNPELHGLSLIKEGLFRQDMIKILCGMAASNTASYLVVLAIDLNEAMKILPYNRALRELYIDSGRLAQNLLLEGMRNFVGGLPSPAMLDSDMCTLLQINPKNCIPIYSVTMGIIAECSITPQASI